MCFTSFMFVNKFVFAESLSAYRILVWTCSGVYFEFWENLMFQDLLETYFNFFFSRVLLFKVGSLWVRHK